ncbi:MAG: hypothetical protein U5P41_13440 [Gammaproteobacteria bacterium]|nr:hypothetical protein [Gammaproteobacteria bacterium]
MTGWALASSDGLDTLSSGKIIQFAEWSTKAKDYVQALLDAVEEAAMPRQDNTTTIVIDILEKDAAAAVTPTAEPADEDEEETEDTKFERTGEIETVASNTGTEAAAAAESAAPTRPEPVVVSSADLEAPNRTMRNHARNLARAAVASSPSRLSSLLLFSSSPISCCGRQPRLLCPPETTVDEAPAIAADDIPEPEAEPEAPPAQEPATTAEAPVTEPATPIEVETFTDSLKSGSPGPCHGQNTRRLLQDGQQSLH